jgi:26S proteasome non-ATPase regulatory subunit 9
MNVIEKAVHAHFAFQQANPLPETSAPTTATANGTNDEQAAQPPRTPAPTLEPPFAKVNSVVGGSPADQAGLKPQDLIRNFGYVNRNNHDGLKKVAECVQGNEGVSTGYISLSMFSSSAFTYDMVTCLHLFLPLC